MEIENIWKIINVITVTKTNVTTVKIISDILTYVNV